MLGRAVIGPQAIPAIGASQAVNWHVFIENPYRPIYPAIDES